MCRTDFRFAVMITILAGLAWSTGASAQGDADGGPINATIDRQAISLRDAASYDIPLKLSAAKQVDLISHSDGMVQAIRVRLSDKAASQSEVVQMDSSVERLEFERAQALYKVAQSEESTEASPAKIEAAKKALELTQLRLDRTNILAPFDGHVFAIHVVEGEFVRAGDPLVTIADQSKLVCEVPIDRSTSKIGDTIDLKIEDTTLSGTLSAIVPLSERFDPLRPLFVSVASGIVEIDNSAGQYLTGQTVYSPMIPRHPVAEVPTTAVANTEDGERKVQVIRNNFVRDVPIQALGSVGELHVFVSGRFSPDDELITQSSEPLLDGTQVTPANATAITPQDNTQTAPTAPGSVPRPPSQKVNVRRR